MPYHRCVACGLTSYSAAAHSSASACPTCAAALTDDSRLYLVAGATYDVSRTLVARPEAAADARRLLVGLALPELTRENLALLVTELVTNAVQHAGLAASDPVRVRVNNRPGGVRLAVHDGGTGFTLAALDDHDPLLAGGRGLSIVAALSDAWGVDCGPSGCTVWCDVDVEEQAVEPLVTTGHLHEMAVELATRQPAAMSPVQEPRPTLP
jgi:anti-sigma regulatory factor (Ser/Thr protein kinase)